MALRGSLLGASRNGAGLGAEQSVLKTAGLREGLGRSSPACEHTAARKVQWGSTGSNWVEFFVGFLVLFFSFFLL